MVNNRFVDLNKRMGPSFRKFLKWRFSRNEKAHIKRNDNWRLSVHKGGEFLHTTENCFVWLGHASFFIQVNGIRILIDPIAGRISGVVPRFADFPCKPEQFKGVNYVLLSHAHRDHCDATTLKTLAAHNEFTVLTALGMRNLIQSWLPGKRIVEAGWYQQYELPEAGLRITYLPSQHWTNYYGWDTNRFLWGSFMIEIDGLNIFFGGDSGYSSYTQKIGELFPNIDIAMLGVGAYTPAFMMQDVHTNPSEAVRAFHDLRAKTMVPMHYGTFDLADEPLSEPYHLLQSYALEGVLQGELLMPDVGVLCKL